jgi:NADH-quinone oxidoreductase subunit N
VNPVIDYHALAPEIVLSVTIILCLLVDLFIPDRPRLVPQLASLGVLAAIIPVLTLAVSGTDVSMFGGAFVVDNYALAFDGLFLVVAYITLLVSFDEIADGDYYGGEYYVLLLTSVLGMVMMASSRDLVSIFIALETISIPTFVLAGWRKHDTKSNEAAIKYFLIGVLSSAVMLYGM